MCMTAGLWICRKKINHQKTYLAGRSDSSGGKAYGGSAEAEDLLYQKKKTKKN